MSERFIDILMATHNGSRFIGEQIESIQSQTYENWRLLVSDDCSNDGTLDVVRRYATKDTRIRVVSEGVYHGGAKENFFSLMGFADAPYCMFCDQDDVWLPEKIEKCLAEMCRLERDCETAVPLLVFCDMKVVDVKLSVISDSFERYVNLSPRRTEFSHVLAQALGAGCSFLMNHELIERSLHCCDLSAIVMHDWWVSLVAAAFGQISYLDESLCLYRQHGGNEVGARRFSAAEWVAKIEKMAERESAIAEQAGCLLDSFAPELDKEQIVSCACLSGSMGPDRAANVLRLFTSGGWKTGVRKLGQVLVSVRGGGGRCSG